MQFAPRAAQHQGVAFGAIPLKDVLLKLRLRISVHLSQ